ncbi:elongation factor P 5-aminopentanone reductase [Lysinibacillus odysseyi]|uniref:3-ketoacyl-ACP synthase n=1 Tax=Lysinibacillus odysseyi 34hs-1 = NBRC 100172 TaxID=1220589 RepID=A0A0A3ISM6_9BACI|nr:SDR family oxidoreductase [Lysinibacillus odysseyi]KGR86485.1 3-ketoacyl-ACP synthase [Lysinibacillus odysseyi 34hs-1 = NBRC 100172]
MKKFALICGASGAIGRAICDELAADGWSLYLHYHLGKERAMKMAASYTDAYPSQEFIPVWADFADPNGADQLAGQLFSVQAVIFANGHAYTQLLEDTPVEEMEKLWRVHVQNPMRLLAVVSQKLRSNTKSYVLFIGSIWGAVGAAGEVVYSAVKGAQHAFVKAYAQEVAYNGIRVNAIAPGFINTQMNGHLSEEEKREIALEIPLQQLGNVEDVSQLTRFYLSGAADYVTGQILHVNGGWYI